MAYAQEGYCEEEQASIERGRVHEQRGRSERARKCARESEKERENEGNVECDSKRARKIQLYVIPRNR